MSQVFNYLQNISAWFWNADVWLPPDFDWDDIKPNERVSYANFDDLIYAFPVAFFMLFLRSCIERFCFTPLGKAYGLQSSPPRQAKLNSELEALYCSRRNWRSYKQIEAAAKKTDLSVRQVERWLRVRKLQDKPPKLVKFNEEGWRSTAYCFLFLYGIVTLWDKSWLWNIRNCWYDYPHHTVPCDIWWYYMLELGFYWSLLLSQFRDTKRKDFWEMFIHHITTILLMSFSWSCNLTRIGTLVMVIHDCADIFLGGAKMANYLNLQRLCDSVFVIFSIMWVVTRLGVFPFWILYSTSIEAPRIVAMFPAYYIFNGLLLLLMLLHFVWTYFISKIAYKALIQGGIERDERSDTDSDISASSSERSTPNHIPNLNQNGK